jgi:NADPH-dependent F420 reductase
MKIAVIGTGNVGGTLGRRWAQGGHRVVFGTRDPQSEKVRKLLDESGGNATAGSAREAAAASEVVVLATPWPVTQATISVAGDLSDKTVVDCTNPIAEGLKGLTVGHTISAGEQVEGWARGARVVKAFSTTGTANMANPKYGNQRVTMFICGNHAEANQTVAGLAEELGFEAVVTGPLYHSRYLEPLAMLWIDMAYAQGKGTDFAFRVLER